MKKVKVTQHALVQRINRCLTKQGEILKKSRSLRTAQDLGDYYIIDFQRNFIVAKNQELEELGRELKVLKGWERIEG